jgi:exonuclease SbcC
MLGEYMTMLGIARKYNQQQQVKKDIKEMKERISQSESNHEAVSDEIERLQQYLKDYVANFFQVDQIQRLYNTIDPHPEYKEIRFECDFSLTKPRLNVYMRNKTEGNDTIVPTLYFSTAQVNILSFCIFMAKALFAKTVDGQDVGCVFIDDPIQALDDINILSMIDLLRNVAFSLDRQIVMTTHDLNFFELLKKKMPKEKFNACYIRFKERGKFEMDGDKDIVGEIRG